MLVIRKYFIRIQIRNPEYGSGSGSRRQINYGSGRNRMLQYLDIFVAIKLPVRIRIQEAIKFRIHWIRIHNDANQHTLLDLSSTCTELGKSSDPLRIKKTFFFLSDFKIKRRSGAKIPESYCTVTSCKQIAYQENNKQCMKA